MCICPYVCSYICMCVSACALVCISQFSSTLSHPPFSAEVLTQFLCLITFNMLFWSTNKCEFLSWNAGHLSSIPHFSSSSSVLYSNSATSRATHIYFTSLRKKYGLLQGIRYKILTRRLSVPWLKTPFAEKCRMSFILKIGGTSGSSHAAPFFVSYPPTHLMIVPTLTNSLPYLFFFLACMGSTYMPWAPTLI